MPASNEQTAYVLPEGYASSGEPQVFQGFPGRWSEGEPVAVADIGLTDERAAELVEELGLPFEKTTAVATGLQSGAELRSGSLPSDDSDRSPVAGLTQEEFDARLAEERAAGQLSPVIEAAARPAGVDTAAEAADQAPTGLPGTHKDLDKLADASSVEWPDTVETVADKQAHLASLGVTGDGS